MGTVYCQHCGTPMDSIAGFCSNCNQTNYAGGQVYQTNSYSNVKGMFQEGIHPSWPIRNKTTAGVLGILLGGFGIHKFYLGKVGLGIVYILFSWTYIPGIIGLIEGILYLCSDEHSFQIKNHVRTQ